MNHNGDSYRPPGLFDQDVYDEDGYLRDARVNLGRSSTVRNRKVARSSAPLGARTKSRAPLSTGRATPGATRRGSNGIVVPLLILLVSLGGLGYVGYERYFAGTDSAAPGQRDAEAVEVSTAGTTALLVQTDGAGDSVGFTMVSLHESGEAVVMFVPASLMVEVPGIGLDTLTSATRIGGVELSSLALENLLTIGFDHVVELTPADLTELTRTFDPLLVENPRRLDQATDRDRIEVLYPAGALLLEASDTADYLARRSVGESELQRLVRHQEFWDSLLMARSEVVSEQRDPSIDFDDYLDELAARGDDIEYRILEVDLVGGEGELYSIDRQSLDSVVGRLDPSRAGTESRIAVQLLNGVGRPGLAAPIARLVNPVGASVELVDNAARFDHEVTQIVYYRDEQLAAAVDIRDALGVGEVVKQLDPIDVVDITVVVGADLADLVEVVTSSAEVVEVDTGSSDVVGQ